MRNFLKKIIGKTVSVLSVALLLSLSGASALAAFVYFQVGIEGDDVTLSPAGEAENQSIYLNAKGSGEVSLAGNTVRVYESDAYTKLWGNTSVSDMLFLSQANGDQVFVGINDTSAPRTVTIASSLIAETKGAAIIIVKDQSGGAATNNITIATEGSELIDGAATKVINTNYGVVRIYSNGAELFTF